MRPGPPVVSLSSDEPGLHQSDAKGHGSDGPTLYPIPSPEGMASPFIPPRIYTLEMLSEINLVDVFFIQGLPI